MGTVRMLTDFAWLTANCYRSRPALLGQRDKRLRELLHYAVKHSPYYREQFREAGLGPDDLDAVPITDLPTLSPRTLEAEFDRIITDPAVSLADLRRFLRQSDDRHTRYCDTYVALRSSGSEGDPTPFLYSEREWDRILAMDMRAILVALGLRSLGDLAGENRIAYIGGVEGKFMGIVGVEETADRFGDTVHPLPPSTPLSDLADRLATLDVTQLVGYPSTLVAVADLVAEGRCRLEVNNVVSAGEPLTADARAYLETTFDAPVVNLYSTTECGPLGVEPPDTPGMYLFDDTVFVEHQEEQTLVTPLFHRTLPLVRFELPDVLDPMPRPANARLPFSMVRSVVGRSEDLLRFPDGLLFSTVLNNVSATGATRFQFVRRDQRSLEVRYQRRPDADPTAVNRRVRAAVADLLAERGLNSVSVLATETDLTYDPHTGKAPLVVHDDTNVPTSGR